MRTTVTSNGMLLDARHLEMLRGGADLLAISLDGVPASHNKMRGSPRAFDHMVSRLDGVRGSGIPFGFIFTLTQHNLDELDWVAHFAVAQGATLLQIHPLEEVGRAVDMPAGCRPDDFEAAVAYLEAARLQRELGARITIKIDLMEREMLRSRPGLVCPEIAPADAPAMPLSALASPLVIEADGTVSPIGYGFARRYVLGNLHANRLRDLTDSWRRHTYPEFNRLCRGVFDEVTGPRDFPFLNWYAILTAYAEQGTAVPAGA
jgi:MoaA/NifB/PqqE/SkfB family radical SAM enzyme